MYTIDEFVNEAIEDISTIFPSVERDADCIIVYNDNEYFSIPISKLYKSYFQTHDYIRTIVGFVANIKKLNREIKLEFDYHKIFPIITNFNNKNGELNYIFTNLFYDIKCCYALDLGHMWRYISTNDILNYCLNENILKKQSFYNISNLSNTLKQVSSGVYGLGFDNGLGSSIYLSDTFKSYINKKFNENYIFIIPTQNDFYISKYSEKNVCKLKKLIYNDYIDEKVSFNLYHYKYGECTVIEKDS
ncbi:MAG: DUF1444 family protein [archaeon]